MIIMIMMTIMIIIIIIIIITIIIIVTIIIIMIVPATTFDERMSNIEFHWNDVNGTRAFSEGVASGRCPVD